MIYSTSTMNQYELVIVLDGKVTGAKKKASIEKLEKLVNVFGGKITATNDWGVKDLAYPINDLLTGAYLIFDVELPGEGAKSLNEKLHLESDIIRYLLVTKEKHSVRIRNHTKPVETVVVDEVI